ncbi:unnamed protein product [Rotaria sordida]|uniref:Metallo-beta-lactamase domain-containing protein n=1 Tax=Rotaria sordida TaxID=392033 RepID=A0A818Y2Y7_9BILA|nr:unnamed protein product [Rotaria sordida]CAF1107066.1 unnamed protein product [Rotaria sordida]CAF3582238.1 unnamed protein product [Rotaria sordida]CAF3745522.1 unnamed protein product [Rotaria sordida]
MPTTLSHQSLNPIQNVDKYELHQIGSGFWNVRSHFKIFAKLIDIETHMSLIQLHNGNFLIIDTVELNDNLRQEINHLTDNGNKIEAVIGTHPFHTLSFRTFYEAYPNAAYYGTPRHLHRLTKIPWVGSLNNCDVRKKWEPDVELRIPAGTEFINPQPESSNHFTCVFVYHPASATLHVDDTIVYTDKPSFLLKLFGYKDGAMAFHPSIKSVGLHPTSDAPYLFRDWMRNMLHDWHFENICCAHMGVKIGGAHADVFALLDKTENLFAKLSKKNRKRNPESELFAGNHHNMNIHGDECG